MNSGVGPRPAIPQVSSRSLCTLSGPLRRRPATAFFYFRFQISGFRFIKDRRIQRGAAQCEVVKGDVEEAEPASEVLFGNLERLRRAVGDVAAFNQPQGVSPRLPCEPAANAVRLIAPRARSAMS